jgi:hypothetical protein
MKSEISMLLNWIKIMIFTKKIKLYNFKKDSKKDSKKYSKKNSIVGFSSASYGVMFKCNVLPGQPI